MGLKDTVQKYSSEGREAPKGKIGEYIIESLAKKYDLSVSKVHAGLTDFVIAGKSYDVKFRDMTLKSTSPFAQAKPKGIEFIYVVARANQVEIHHKIEKFPDTPGKTIKEAYDDDGKRYKRFAITWSDAEKYAGDAALEIERSEKDIGATLDLIEPIKKWASQTIGKCRVIYKEGGYKDNKGPQTFYTSQDTGMTILLFIENGKILQIHAYPWEERDNIGWIPYMGRKTYIMKNLSERYIFDSLEEFKAEVKDRFK